MKGVQRMRISRNSSADTQVSVPVEPETRTRKEIILARLKNVWDYYRVLIIIVAVALVLLTRFAITLGRQNPPDFRLYYITDARLESADYEKATATIWPYVTDVYPDGKILVHDRYIRLPAIPEEGVDPDTYEHVLAVLNDSTAALIVVDEFVFNFLLKREAIVPLEDYGVAFEFDKYRIPLNNTFLLEDTQMKDTFRSFYLVFRTCPEALRDDPKVQARYEIAQAIMADVAASYSASFK